MSGKEKVPARKFLTTGDAAKLCKVSRRTVYEWIQSGRLPAFKTLGGHHRIDREDIVRLLRPTAISPDQGEE